MKIVILVLIFSVMSTVGCRKDGDTIKSEELVARKACLDKGGVPLSNWTGSMSGCQFAPCKCAKEKK